ncbi:M20/M25/M40 family metallo-hydrolase [Candidatus Nitronereus thalassa]|uniref:M20/M25/M40 family metallo-hydrolase n=1 Tax=Candidatus Nitronereus thalassa TaxID=3020898 RepID=A0ABU3K754_9BACT|nr:M20/M25/M40 family metallo-hydrolase [Candidatus Nitronereus thalassa]MDT7042185.1 M20/M25/M40 family metallo-hydrolase [Candidatus Nitronereus thalassa]
MTKRNAHLESYIRSSRSHFEDLLSQMVETPSISSDPDRVKDINRMATLGMQSLKSFGAQARLVKTGGYPAVSGGWQVGKQYPTLTIYNHLDVQPAQEPEWRQEPFQFCKEGNRYRGRGTTDDKGPALTALFAARYAVEQGVPLNIRFLWELEEEIGSPNFQDALDQKTLVPRPDSVLISDTIWVSRQRPAVPTGLRGLLAAQLTLRTGTTDVHSGLTGGGARNPLAELCEAVHACVDAQTGRVKIPGFYDHVVPPSPRDMKEFLSSGFEVARFKKAYGLRSIRTEDRANLVKRIWAAPTFEVHGLVGGYSGPGVKTAVPPCGRLKISMRLVPNQQPQKIFSQLQAFIKKHNPDIHVECDEQLEPFQGITSGPYAEALRKAVHVGFSITPSFVREGGSIGAVKLMERAWKVPILFMGLSLPEHGYHAPNEFFDWAQASGGIRAFVEYFSQIAHMRDG